MTGSAARDRRMVAAVCRWFTANARPMPWRITPRDPYLSLVSEFMLQQTQVSRVLEKLPVFMDRFPTVTSLAASDPHDVLAAWSGMGYYRRASNLHAAARAIVERHAGRVPASVEHLRDLPGVGRYTAGAVASIAFGRGEAAVDGNVTRVLLRLEGRPLRHGSPEALRWAWGRAGTLIGHTGPVGEPGAFNEGLMELGATVCTPRNPRCRECPVRRWCVARAGGRQDRIPLPQSEPRRRTLHCAAVVIEDPRGWVLVERRADRGLWAGLWQAPTIESGGRAASAKAVAAFCGVNGVRRVERFTSVLSHREVVFDVWRTAVTAGDARRVVAARDGARFVTRVAAAGLPLSSVQRRILAIAR